jgi:Na+-transporting methylmalonyl-CoA/oxaloacetate decarboxylase gamma subunit
MFLESIVTVFCCVSIVLILLIVLLIYTFRDVISLAWKSSRIPPKRSNKKNEKTRIDEKVDVEDAEFREVTK